MKMHTCSTFWSISTVVLCVSLRFERKKERRKKNKQKTKLETRTRKRAARKVCSSPCNPCPSFRITRIPILFQSYRFLSSFSTARDEKSEKRKIETTQNYMSEKNNTGSRERETSAYIVHTLPWLYPGYKKGYKRVGVSFSLQSPLHSIQVGFSMQMHLSRRIYTLYRDITNVWNSNRLSSVGSFLKLTGQKR